MESQANRKPIRRKKLMDDHEIEVKLLALTMVAFALIKLNPDLAKDALQILRGMTRFRPAMPGATDASVTFDAIEFIENLVQLSN